MSAVPISPSPLRSAVGDRGIATITFDRPHKANSYDAAMLEALALGIERFQDDEAVRVIVLRGAGKHFCAGAAIGAPGKSAGAPAGHGIVQLCALLDAVRKPTIAAVHGACIGGGGGGGRRGGVCA